MNLHEPINRRTHVLVVEDDDMLQTVLRLVLEAAGLECTVVGNGLAGLEHMRSHSYDLILTDMRMPTMSGLEMIQAARSLGDPLPPVIVLSGYHDHTERDLFGAGVSRVLQKPVGLAALRAEIFAVLDGKSGAGEPGDRHRRA